MTLQRLTWCALPNAASRDQSVKLWCNDEQNGATIYKPLETRLQHKVVMVMMLPVTVCVTASLVPAPLLVAVQDIIFEMGMSTLGSANFLL